MRIAPAREWLSRHILHREIRLPGAVDARIVETGDVRVLEGRQNVALAVKALLELAAHEHEGRYLQGHRALQRAVPTPREPHLRHPAGSERPNQLVGSDACPGLQAARGLVVTRPASRELRQRSE